MLLHVPLVVPQPPLVMVQINIKRFNLPEWGGPESICNGEMKQCHPQSSECVVQTEKQDQRRCLCGQNIDRGRSSKVQGPWLGYHGSHHEDHPCRCTPPQPFKVPGCLGEHCRWLIQPDAGGPSTCLHAERPCCNHGKKCQEAEHGGSLEPWHRVDYRLYLSP